MMLNQPKTLAEAVCQLVVVGGRVRDRDAKRILATVKEHLAGGDGLEGDGHE